MTGLRIDHPDGLWDPAGYFRDPARGLAYPESQTPYPSDGESTSATVYRPLGASGGWG